ncbi:hypothetical protein EDB81DRAFT_789708 [Dactylonectria macrodidyma]|uniref:Uncharacterized protein n=1 Tax=Dactylonectria macrodidyma TaxID=307937 RepID=A0A9P9F4P0_9HYPO|nr:hypothetical protein EDB81DRAFT_789708 [Dactylonectria macrodidyma]
MKFTPPGRWCGVASSIGSAVWLECGSRPGREGSESRVGIRTRTASFKLVSSPRIRLSLSLLPQLPGDCNNTPEPTACNHTTSPPAPHGCFCTTYREYYLRSRHSGHLKPWGILCLPPLPQVHVRVPPGHRQRPFGPVNPIRLPIPGPSSSSCGLQDPGHRLGTRPSTPASLSLSPHLLLLLRKVRSAP